VDPKGVLQRSLRKPDAFVTVAYDSLVKWIVGRMYDRWLRDDIGPIVDLYFVVAVPHFISGETAITYRAAGLLRGGLLERLEPNLKIWIRRYVRWWLGLAHIDEQTPGYDPPGRSCKDPHFTSPSLHPCPLTFTRCRCCRHAAGRQFARFIARSPVHSDGTRTTR
jgi:hypothetical protein